MKLTWQDYPVCGHSVIVPTAHSLTLMLDLLAASAASGERLNITVHLSAEDLRGTAAAALNRSDARGTDSE